MKHTSLPAYITAQLSLFPEELCGFFAGTDNPRHLRSLSALMLRPVMREELDKIAGCSNGPALIDDLRQHGLEIRCIRLTSTDRDGKQCRPGQYELTPNDVRLIHSWLTRSGRKSEYLTTH